MKYEYIGEKVFYTGKTLWEIVGNLKGFGVGRLVRMEKTPNYESIFKIIKVQPIPPPKIPKFRTVQNLERGLIAWVEEMNRGIKQPIVQLDDECALTKFKLIEKTEEEAYYKHFAELTKNFTPKIIPKFVACPPLYKILWEEKRNSLKMNLHGPVLLRKVTNDECGFVKTSDGNETVLPSTCNLYKNEAPVESLIKEIVRLKKQIKSNSA